MRIQYFAEARQALSAFYNMHSEYKLDTLRSFMRQLGDPQDKIQVIHVAGTSGKTSTCYLTAALLQAAGKKVGLTVSPHVDEINERVQVDLQPLAEPEFCRELGDFLDIVHLSGLALSYFEVMVAFVYWYFAKIQVDYAVVEVGLGGLLDGTNVITRPDKVCVLTAIGLDHTKILGATLPEIAAQKAGIILQGNEVFTGPQPDEVMDVFRAAAANQSAHLHEVGVFDPNFYPTLPDFQRQNMWLARAAADQVLTRQNEQLTDDMIEQAAGVYIPARMEIMYAHEVPVIVDGAHNSQKLHALLEGVRSMYPDRPLAVIVAFVDTDLSRAREGLDELMRYADQLIITAFQQEQDVPRVALDPSVIAQYCRDQGYTAIEIERDPASALNRLLTVKDHTLLVTGSFYLLNDIRPLLGRSPQ